MKKIFLASLLSVSFLFVGCDEGANDGRFEPSPETGWVQFENQGTTSVAAGDELVTIPVVLQVPVNKDGILVNYSISDVEGNLSSQVTSEGTVLIPAGSREGEIVVNLSPSIAACGNLLVTLEATNNAGVSVGLSDNSKPVTHNINIIGNRDMMLGTYDVLEDGTYNYQVEIVAGDAPNEIIVKGLYEISPDTETRLFLNSATGKVEYPPLLENLLFTSTNPAQGNVYVAGEAVSGSNVFDSCNNTLDISFRLRFGPTQNNQTAVINAVMTRVSDN